MEKVRGEKNDKINITVTGETACFFLVEIVRPDLWEMSNYEHNRAGKHMGLGLWPQRNGTHPPGLIRLLPRNDLDFVL